MSVIFSTFFTSLSFETLSECKELISEVVNRREQMHDKEFKRIFESILCTYGIEEVLKIYPMTLNGDIANESFED